MKTVKIGKTEYEQMESPFDIGDERFYVFKQHILKSYEGIDTPSFMVMHNKITKHFNAGDHYKTLVELENFKSALNFGKLNYDSFSFCFALMTMQEGEKMGDFGKDYQETKLKKMREDGLNRGEVEKVVENFMLAFPKHFAPYLGMLELMKGVSKDEILSALEN